MHPVPHPVQGSGPLVRMLQLATVLGLVALLVLVLRPAPARADTITVDTLDDVADGSNCSLRQAIQAASMHMKMGNCAAGSGENIITFAPNVTGTITLNDTLMVPSGTLTIRGPGRASLTIDGGNEVRLFDVAAPVQLNLEGLTLANGSGGGAFRSGHGAAIYNDGGSLTITDSTFEGNQASGEGSGGAIYSTGGSLTITGSTFGNNGAKARTGVVLNEDGGAIYQSGGSLTITNSTFGGNEAWDHGGAIYHTGGNLSITGSTFRNNAAYYNGGAIYHTGGSLSITSSTFAENCACNDFSPRLFSSYGGAIYDDGGGLSVKDSTFTSNIAHDYGGAIYVAGGSPIVSGSTFTGNESQNGDGGAIYLYKGTLNLTNSTIDSNKSWDHAGAIYIYYGALTLTSSTLSNNQTSGYGGALYSDGGPISITNSTLAGNQAAPKYGGAAIYHDGGSGRALSITSSTIASNQSGDRATLLVNSGGASLTNVLLANANGGSRNCSSGITDGGGNFADDTSCDFTLASSHNMTNPELGQLADNRGPTKTMALKSDSPAIGKGKPPCPELDQRGERRTGRCDSGAVQIGTPPATPTVTSLNPTSGPAAGGTVVTIEGTGFGTTAGTTAVSFGPNPGTNVSCSATMRCKVTSPSGTGSVDVRVTVDGHTSPDTPADSFSYQPGPSPTPTPTPSPAPGPTPTPTPSPTPAPHMLSATITGCTAQGSDVYRCELQVTLGAGTPANTVLQVGISDGTYSNPDGAGSPMVSSSEGCTNPPNPSPYLPINGRYVRYDVTISDGGCQAGAVVTFAEDVSGRPGTAIMQTVSATNHGSASASFTLP